jgi:hypothetical protein
LSTYSYPTNVPFEHYWRFVNVIDSVVNLRNFVCKLEALKAIDSFSVRSRRGDHIHACREFDFSLNSRQRERMSWGNNPLPAVHSLSMEDYKYYY